MPIPTPLAPRATTPEARRLPKVIAVSVKQLLNKGVSTEQILAKLEICENIPSRPSQLLAIERALRKNRSVARSLIESKNGNGLRKLKLNIELLNDALLKLQTERSTTFSLKEAAAFSRALREVSAAAKNDLAMQNEIEASLKQKQSRSLEKAQKRGSINPTAVRAAMEILGLS